MARLLWKLALTAFFMLGAASRLCALEVAVGASSANLTAIAAEQKSVARPAGTVRSGVGKEYKGGKGATTPAQVAHAPLTDKFNLGIGIGFFNLFLPQPALQAIYLYKSKLQIGLQLGYIMLPLSSFSGQSTYVGGDVKYRPSSGPFFFGIAAGMRTIAIATTAPITVNGVDTDVVWHRSVSQNVIIPRIGWVKIGADGTGTTLSLGYLVPLGTNFSVTADPEGVPGFPVDQFEAERTKKGNDVKKYTNVGYPHIEFSYFWYLDMF